jgi:hypothetical protein
MDKQISKEEQSKNEGKELKKLLESYTAVARHKLNREPQLEDLVKMLSEDSQHQEDIHPTKEPTPIASQPVGQKAIDVATNSQAKQEVTAEPLDKADEPKILSTKIYYGLSGKEGEKKPDPHQILYYENRDGHFFDTNSQSWSPDRPPMADHLPCRPVSSSEKDIVALIAHGVMDAEDFSHLDKSQMIGPTPKRLWELTNKVKSHLGELSKSDDSLEDDDDDNFGQEPQQSENSGEIELHPYDESNDDVLSQFMDETNSESNSEEPSMDVSGDDVLEQIIQAALGATLESGDLEEKIRRIVREELGRG